MGLAVLAVAASLNAAPVGHPPYRRYSFEEIGFVARGSPLCVDGHGRIGVSGANGYVVLNDTTWENLLEPESSPIALDVVRADSSGTLYYGSLASWGRLEKTQSGHYRAVPMLEGPAPSWVGSTYFNQLLITPDNIYIVGFNGLIRWDRHSARSHYLPVTNVSVAFVYNGEVYVSTHAHELLKLNQETGELVRDPHEAFKQQTVRHFIQTGKDSALVATMGRRLFRLTEGTLKPLSGRLRDDLPGPVLAMQQLPEGDIAVSIGSLGVLILDSAGNIKSEVAGPGDPQVNDIACTETDVLWGATEHGIVKIFYRSPFCTFGQADGVPVFWPQIVTWNDRIVVASGGRFYESVPNVQQGGRTFRAMKDEPSIGGWGITTVGDTLLVGNNMGVFARTPDAPFECVLPSFDAFRLAAVESGICFAIGENEIAVLKKVGGAWQEAAPRIRGAGNPFNVHSVGEAVWIELGVNRVARLSMHSGAMQLQLFKDFDWESGWIHVSSVGRRVILAGAKEQRRYFDEETARFTSADDLDRLLSSSPVPVRRLLRDTNGVYWGAHDGGILTLTPKGSTVAVDQRTFAGISDVVPQLKLLAGGDLWVCGGHSLYRVLAARSTPEVGVVSSPVLVGVKDDRTNRDLLTQDDGDAWRRLPYRQNSLTLTFFRGTYEGYRPQGYRYRLNDGPWLSEKNSARLSLYDLHEGDYHLAVQAVDEVGPVDGVSAFDFTVLSPWYRTWWAFAMYGSLGGLALYAAARFSVRHTRARNDELQRLVAERTRQLESTMEQLQQEAKERATLAERNRLAHEIHDSLEQGFTGLAMQLEATSRLNRVTPEVAAGINTAIEMISYCRKEVRNAVRNLHSAMLGEQGLDGALRQLIKQVGMPEGAASLNVVGTPHAISSSVEHHLIRIAQEAVANVVKHARARRLTIILNYKDGEVELTVADDGVGLTPSSDASTFAGHFGVPSIRERVNKMGGTLEIVSAPGKGTRLRVRIPMFSPILDPI